MYEIDTGKKKSLAKLAALKKVDKKIYKHSTIDEEEEHVLSAASQNDTGFKNTKSFKNSNIRTNLHPQNKENGITHKNNIDKIQTNSSSNSSNVNIESGKSRVLSTTTSFEFHQSSQHKKLQGPCKSLSEKDFYMMMMDDDKQIHKISSLKNQENNEGGIYVKRDMDSDTNSISNVSLVQSSSSKLVSQDETLPPIENISREEFPVYNKNESFIENNADSSSSSISKNTGSKLSGKQKLLKIHSQDDEVVKAGDDNSDDEFGGVYCGPTDPPSSSKLIKDSSKTNVVNQVSPKTAEDSSNLSRNHSLKYSGGALHDDRNPVSFDHTFSQRPKDPQCKRKHTHKNDPPQESYSMIKTHKKFNVR